MGYCGGTTENPTYETVCSGSTGHAEAVQVDFDPTRISYEKLLEVFWKCHDPTARHAKTDGRRSQYRSVIFFHTPGQRAAAERSRDQLVQAGPSRRPVATEIVPAGVFWRAEEYHQRYYLKATERSRRACGL